MKVPLFLILLAPEMRKGPILIGIADPPPVIALLVLLSKVACPQPSAA